MINAVIEMDAMVKPSQFIVNTKGRPMAVVLSMETYQKLLKLVEDQRDSRLLKQAIRTSRSTLSHARLLGRLKRQHLI